MNGAAMNDSSWSNDKAWESEETMKAIFRSDALEILATAPEKAAKISHAHTYHHLAFSYLAARTPLYLAKDWASWRNGSPDIVEFSDACKVELDRMFESQFYALASQRLDRAEAYVIEKSSEELL